MKPKPKRGKLKWVADRFSAGEEYSVESTGYGTWRAFFWTARSAYQSRFTTKREAIAACERHARQMKKGRN